MTMCPRSLTAGWDEGHSVPCIMDGRILECPLPAQDRPREAIQSLGEPTSSAVTHLTGISSNTAEVTLPFCIFRQWLVQIFHILPLIAAQTLTLNWLSIVWSQANSAHLEITHYFTLPQIFALTPFWGFLPAYQNVPSAYYYVILADNKVLLTPYLTFHKTAAAEHSFCWTVLYFLC